MATLLKDAYPNYISGRVTQSGADAFTNLVVDTPVPRLEAIIGDNVRIMEVLWVDFVWDNQGLNAANEFMILQLSHGNAPSAIRDFSNSNVFAYWKREMELLTSGAGMSDQPFRFNCQTEEGFGYLLAANEFNFSIDSGSTGGTNIGDFRLAYRFVEVDVREILGMLQSQQPRSE